MCLILSHSYGWQEQADFKMHTLARKGVGPAKLALLQTLTGQLCPCKDMEKTDPFKKGSRKPAE